MKHDASMQPRANPAPSQHQHISNPSAIQRKPQRNTTQYNARSHYNQIELILRIVLNLDKDDIPRQIHFPTYVKSVEAAIIFTVNEFSVVSKLVKLPFFMRDYQLNSFVTK